LSEDLLTDHKDKKGKIFFDCWLDNLKASFAKTKDRRFSSLNLNVASNRCYTVL